MDKPEYIANIIGFVDKYLLHTLHQYHAAAIITSILFVLTGSLLIALYYAVKNAHGYITTGRVLGVVVNSNYGAKDKEKKKGSAKKDEDDNITGIKIRKINMKHVNFIIIC